MNLVILIPIVVLVVLAMVFFYARKNRARGGGDGMGNRNDAMERPELRGEAQWRARNPESRRE